jgi:hypothetical protein
MILLALGWQTEALGSMASYFNWASGVFGAGQSNPDLQSSGMLTKEQLRQLFRDFSNTLDQPGEHAFCCFLMA